MSERDDVASSPDQEQPRQQQPPGDGDARRHRPTTDRQLNSRQRQFLDVMFELDEQAERDQRRRWHQGLPREPADQWRWIPYATHQAHGSPTPAQQALAARGIRSTASGPTLAALLRRGLLESQHVTIDTVGGLARQTQVRLTPAGRRTARMARPPTDVGPAVLPPWLHEALALVADAQPPGLPKVDISRVAARRLGPKEFGYIKDSMPWAYTLTKTGWDYLATSRQRNCGQRIGNKHAP